MTLKKGVGKKVIQKNIREMVKAGHKKEVAIAASLHNAKLGVGKKNG